MRPNLGFIVEGHCEYDGIPSIVGKTLGYFNFPIQNAGGIGNIIKHIDNQLLSMIRFHKPKRIIVTLDLKEAIKDGLFNSCSELKSHLIDSTDEFIRSQQNGSLTLPESIIIVIANRTYDTWICSDTDGLKSCDLIDSEKITEEFNDVDSEIPNPSYWLQSKTKQRIDLKNRRYRKILISAIDPNVGKDYSRSFRKFIKEVQLNSG